MSAMQKMDRGKSTKTDRGRRTIRSKGAVDAGKRPKSGDEVLRVKTIRSKLGLKQAQMSRLLGISPRTLSELECRAKTPRAETKRRLTEIDRLRQALAALMDADEIAPWMDEANDALGGSTPLQVVERGEIDRLWQMIYAVRTGHPL